MQLQDLSYILNNQKIKTKLPYYQNIKVSLEIFSLENVYTIPSFNKKNNQYLSSSIVWGDVEKVEGNALLDIKDKNNYLEINAKAKLDKKIRSIKIRFDDLPLGKLISRSGEDLGVSEYGIRLHYPEGWRDLSYPLLVFELKTHQYLYIRCLDKEINMKYFFIKKTGNKMRVDVVQEQEGASIKKNYTIPPIEIGIVEDKKEIYRRQQEIMEQYFGLVPFYANPITPSWLKNISLVVIMHMESFTGHIFHTYQKAYEDVKKLTSMLPGEQILVYFPGWEGRYYFKYGNYTPDERLGGAEALKECIKNIQALGCKTMSMVGINIANKNIREVKAIYKESEFQSVSGAKYHNGSVDWEGAHHYDFNELVNLSIASKKWGDLLYNQIKDISLTYGFDGVFLDIAACFTNDKNHSFYPGLVEFCNRLRTIKDDFLVSGEGYYDGLSKVMPLFQSGHTDGRMNYHDRIDEELFNKYSREFGHLCLGDPSVGSSGVHELGINTEYKVPFRKGIIPTLSLVENSLEKGEEKVKEIINQAKDYYKEFIA